MQLYDFKVLLDPDGEMGGYVVTCPALPGCYSQGDTTDEALANIKEAILLCLEDMQAWNQPVLDMSRTLQSSASHCARSCFSQARPLAPAIARC